MLRCLTAVALVLVLSGCKLNPFAKDEPVAPMYPPQMSPVSVSPSCVPIAHRHGPISPEEAVAYIQELRAALNAACMRK